MSETWSPFELKYAKPPYLSSASVSSSSSAASPVRDPITSFSWRRQSSAGIGYTNAKKCAFSEIDARVRADRDRLIAQSGEVRVSYSLPSIVTTASPASFDVSYPSKREPWRGRSVALSFGIGSSFSLLPGSSKVVSASGITARSDGSWRLSSCVRPGKNADIFRVI